MRQHEKKRIAVLLAAALFILSAAGCENDAAKPAGIASSVPGSSSGEISNSRASSAGSSQAGQSVTGYRQAVDMDRYGLVYRSDKAGVAYSVDGTIYIGLTDIAALAKAAVAYDSSSRTVTFGERTHPRVDFYMPDLSAYPEFDGGNSLLDMYWRSDGATDLSFSKRGQSFQKMARLEVEKLKSYGFSAATEKQYAALAGSLEEFKQGERKYTYVKTGVGQAEYAVQLIDGSTRSGRSPVMITRMKARPGYSSKTWTENPSNVITRKFYTDSGKTSAAQTTVAAVKMRITVKYYGLQAETEACAVGGKPYLSLEDVSRLFRTRLVYDPTDPSISFGDGLGAEVHPFDLSEYPNPEDLIGFSPSEIRSEDGLVVCYRFMVKNASFQNLSKRIGEKLTSAGFTAMTEKQFSEIPETQRVSAFQQGKRENTYLKNNRVQYGDEELSSQTFQSIFQILDGGTDKDGNLDVTVKMLDGYYM